MSIHKEMYLAWWRLLETPDEYMTGPSWWPLYGLDLSAQALEKIYRGNALRLLNWEPQK